MFIGESRSSDSNSQKESNFSRIGVGEEFLLNTKYVVEYLLSFFSLCLGF